MKTIELSQGFVALVDDDKFDEINKHKWYCHHGYAIRKEGEATPQINMEHVVFGHVTKLDHNDGNRLNNQLWNLRPVTHSVNIQKAKLRSTNTSGFRGVNFHKATGKWIARITKDNIRLDLGSFSTAEEAAKVYDEAAFKLFGALAAFNFPRPMPHIPNIFG